MSGLSQQRRWKDRLDEEEVIVGVLDLEGERKRGRQTTCHRGCHGGETIEVDSPINDQEDKSTYFYCVVGCPTNAGAPSKLPTELCRMGLIPAHL